MNKHWNVSNYELNFIVASRGLTANHNESLDGVIEQDYQRFKIQFEANEEDYLESVIERSTDYIEEIQADIADVEEAKHGVLEEIDEEIRTIYGALPRPLFWLEDFEAQSAYKYDKHICYQIIY